MTRFHFTTSDVFTATPFGGNPLAVFTDAHTMSDAAMQAIAKEFGFSETVFIVPSEGSAEDSADEGWPIRIFTPSREVPFAGHPTVGTALTLVRLGKVSIEGERVRLILQEKAGPVSVEITLRGRQPVSARFKTPRQPEFLREIAPLPVAEGLGLTSEDLADKDQPVIFASCGLPFPFLEVRSLAALAKIVVKPDKLDAVLTPDPAEIVVFAKDESELDADWRVRMFAPGNGIPEDPATGSAAASLAGLLARRETAASGTFRWRIAQGVEMGRPSRIDVEAIKENGQITAVFVEGGAVPMGEGWFEVSD